MKKWEIAKKVVTLSLATALAIIPFALILAAVGTFITTLAMHLGAQIAGGQSTGVQVPTWLDPVRIVSAIGSAITALSGALIAVGTIEYQRFRQRTQIRGAARALLDDAMAQFATFRTLKSDKNTAAEHARADLAGTLIAAMTIAEKASGEDEAMARLYARMRPRLRQFNVLAGDGEPIDFLQSEFQIALRLAGQIPDWRALLD